VYYKMILAGLWAPKKEEEEYMDLSDIKIPQPPTAEETKEFEVLKTGGPSLTNFRLDFRQGQTKGPWNRLAATIFADAFIKSKRYIRQRQKDVENSFLSHLRTIAKHYQIQQQQRAQRTQKEREDNRRNRRRKRRAHVSSAPNCG
jgi:hypothetical protein